MRLIWIRKQNSELFLEISRSLLILLPFFCSYHLYYYKANGKGVLYLLLEQNSATEYKVISNLGGGMILMQK